jgi:hypothetical protein
MDSILNTLSTREKALVVWIIVLPLYISLNKTLRDSVFGVLKMMFFTKLSIVFIGTIIYTGVMSTFLRYLGLWNLFLVKDTVFWLIGTAFVLLYGIDKATRDAGHLRRVLLSIFALTFILEYIVNLYTFSFWLEIILVPIFVMIGGMLGLAGTKNEYKPVQNLLNYVLILFGIFSIVYAISKIATNFQDFATLYNLRTFLIEPILTIGYIPFLYLFALIMVYESLYVRINMFIKNNKDLSSYAKWEIFKLCHFNLAKIIKFSQGTGVEISQISNKKDVSRMISSYKGKAN